MAEPARRRVEHAPPPYDRAAIERAYRLHRARRRARLEHRRETRLARLRFWLVLLVLLAGSAALAVTIWRQIQRLFGL